MIIGNYIESKQYQKITVSLKDVNTEEDLFKTFYQQLNFSKYFGFNWDALEECLSQPSFEVNSDIMYIITDCKSCLKNFDNKLIGFFNRLVECGIEDLDTNKHYNCVVQIEEYSNKGRKMIKKIRLNLEYGCYPVWLYNENNELIDTLLPYEIRDNNELDLAFDNLQKRYESLFVNNSKEFYYKGFLSKADEEQFLKDWNLAVKMLADAVNDKYELIDEFKKSIILTVEEQNFITQNIDNGKEYLQKEDWNKIIRELDALELQIGYIDNDFDKGINDTGRYIELLIDKIAYADFLILE